MKEERNEKMPRIKEEKAENIEDCDANVEKELFIMKCEVNHEPPIPELKMTRPTYQQLEAITDFLEANPGIAKGIMRSANGKNETKRKWERVAVTINSLGGAQKDGRGWAKYWADKKCALKKTCAQFAQSQRLTGGAPGDLIPNLSPLEHRLVAAIGGQQTAAREGNVVVNAFPSSSQAAIQFEEAALCVPETSIASTTPLQAVETATTTISPPQSRERSPIHSHGIRRPRRRVRRTVLDQDRAQFAAIETKRVEAEIVTARALSRAGKRMDNLAKAIREGSQIVADALDRIAAALRNDRTE